MVAAGAWGFAVNQVSALLRSSEAIGRRPSLIFFLPWRVSSWTRLLVALAICGTRFQRVCGFPLCCLVELGLVGTRAWVCLSFALFSRDRRLVVQLQTNLISRTFVGDHTGDVVGAGSGCLEFGGHRSGSTTKAPLRVVLLKFCVVGVVVVRWREVARSHFGFVNVVSG